MSRWFTFGCCNQLCIQSFYLGSVFWEVGEVGGFGRVRAKVDEPDWFEWVGGWVGGWMGRGDKGGLNELLSCRRGWVGGWR